MPVPHWVRWFLQFGYRWSHRRGHRRICIVSTPCESPAAALIALGLMRRRLEVPEAGDLANHMGRLRDLYTSGATQVVLRRLPNKKRFHFAGIDRDGALWAHMAGRPCPRYKIIEEFAFDWYVEGEPPVQATRDAPVVLSVILEALFDGSTAVLHKNLALTDSAICLAGRVAGEQQTHADLSTVRFRYGESAESLGSLLTVHGWHEGRVSRVAYFNSRTQSLDRAVGAMQTVSADGAAALVRVAAEPHFREADIIAVVPRTADPDQLESASQYLASLAQWYTPRRFDDTVGLGKMPHGVSIIWLGKD